MKKNNQFLESENEMGHEADDGENPKGGATSDHSDEEQDKALFAKMIKQYLGKENPDETETEMAKQAYQAHKEKGLEHEAAMEAAGKHLQMAAEIGKKMHQAMQKHENENETHESEKKEDESECGKQEDESESEKKEDEKKEGEKVPPSPGKKESAKAIAKLSGEIAQLRESLKKYELSEYLEKKLKNSGESNSCTKLFREALGNPRSKQHIDETWNTFMKAFKAGSSEEVSDSALFMEKNPRVSSGKKLSFSDCIED